MTAETKTELSASASMVGATGEQQATITAPAITESKLPNKEVTLPLRKQQNSNNVDSIKDYLAKPRYLSTFVWSTADPSAALLQLVNSFAFANDPVFLDKVQGFSGMRYTTNFKLILNATPFQQGKLRVVYAPNARQSQNLWNARRSNLVTLTQLPGVDITTMDHSVEIKVPFTSYQEYVEFNNFRDPLTFAVHVLSPLQTGPTALSVTATFSLWVWYTDVELFGTSTRTVQPQSGKITRRKNVSEMEEKPLSTWLSASSNLAGSLSSIPMLSSVTGPTSIVLKYAAGLASAFGYSRPLNGEPVRSMAPHYHSANPNADGLNVSSVLAMNKDAKARLIEDYSPSGMDEMSLNFIKRQWSFLDQFTITTATVPEAQVYQLGLGPVGNVLSNRYNYYTPVGFLNEIFRYYRGGVEIGFKFIKTGFHACSLQASYEVGDALSPSTLDINSTNVLHRTVVDIQQGDEVCLSFPFMSSRAYLQTGTTYGLLRVHVVNSLVCPETVAQNIVCQVYIRGMEDLEFSGIANQTLLNPAFNLPRIAPQGMGTEEQGEIICQPVGGALVEPKMTGDFMTDSMSENVTSLLQFAKVGCLSRFRLPANAGGGVNFAFNPSAFGASFFTDSTAGSTLVYPTFQCQNLNIIRGCYAYQRGGYEIGIIPKLTSADARQTTYAMLNLDFGAPPTFSNGFPETINVGMQNLAPAAQENSIRSHVAANNGEYGLSVTVPYRNRYRVAPIYPYSSTQTAIANNVVPSTVDGTNAEEFTERNRVAIFAHADDTMILRPGEDFQLLYWLGVMPFRQN